MGVPCSPVTPGMGGVAGDLDMDYRVYADLMRLILEIICEILENSLQHNPQLGILAII